MLLQIMADSADMCSKSIVRHCPSARLVPRLCSVLLKDRSAKLRQCCAEYLIQVSQGPLYWACANSGPGIQIAASNYQLGHNIACKDCFKCDLNEAAIKCFSVRRRSMT